MTQEPQVAQYRSTRSQRHAESALARITAVVAWSDEQKDAKDASKLRKEYKARADGFPVLVMQAGLAQAVGFMRAKSADKPAYGRYLDDLAAVIGGLADGAALHHRAIHGQLPAYRQLTREVLAAAGWLKRFGQVYLSDKGGQP